ncbi:MAG TPA: hypothetical protein VKT29_16905 [Terriglobales bacterium]|nr:hypothetical protein [Terriglobales bacterium]
MNLIDRLRSAEHQGRDAAWQSFSRARLSLEEAQSKLRRKMRIRPSGKPSLLESRRGEPLASEQPQPIVSINGEDVQPGKLENPQRTGSAA